VEARAGKYETMSEPPLTPLSLDEILAGVHEELENGASAPRIREIAEEHPKARNEILAFAAEWFASDGSDLSDDDSVVNRTAREHHALLERFWHAAAADDAQPFDSLSLNKLEDVAGRCRIDLDILRQLVRHKVDEMTIPGKLVGWLGAELGLPQQAMWAALSSADAVAYADFFAPGGKKFGAKINFEEVIRESDLDPADKRYWLDRLED
jgi:hypothetical protein